MKYFLSVCCIIKNERYLEEFIIYHHIVGVEHFYIYDNESDRPISDRLKNFYFERLCTVINFPGKNQQFPAYQHCIKNYGNETKWLAIIDGDEFILPKQKFWTIRDLLVKHETAQAIGINWVNFGSNFHDNIQKGFQVDNYRRCENKFNPHIKSIVQPQYVITINHPHFATIKDTTKYIDCKGNIINGPFNSFDTTDLIQINHYHFRSLEDYKQKKKRGNADGPAHVKVNEKTHHSICNDIVDDYLPDKYLKHLKYYNKMIATNPKIYCALNKDVDFNRVYQHIFDNAQREKRPCHITDKYPNFNKTFYRKNYPNLSSLNDEDLELHFINHGFKEGKIADKLIN
jgi:hypothetical protein